MSALHAFYELLYLSIQYPHIHAAAHTIVDTGEGGYKYW